MTEGFHGLINEDPRDSDYVLGAEEITGGSDWQRLQGFSNGILTWKDDEPEYENQNKNGVETNACVPFSGNNVAEYVCNNKMKDDTDFASLLANAGLVKNGKANFSDRRTAKGSGTDPNTGNTVRAVDDYIRKNFFCPEDLWSFPEGMTRDQFYSVMPAEVADYGKKITFFEIETKYLMAAPGNMYFAYSTPEQIWDGLQFSPVWASVDGRYKWDGDIVVGSNAEFQYTHRITIRGGVYGKYWEVHDHYLKQIKKFKWDYQFGNCKVMQIIKTKVPEVIRVGQEIAFLAKSGKFAGQYISYGSGDIMLALHGSYLPEERKQLPEWPKNYSGLKINIQ